MDNSLIKSTFWNSMTEDETPFLSRYLYLYFLTCKENTLIGIFQLTRKQIELDTNLSQEQIQQAKQWLLSHDKLLICRDYFFITNTPRHNSYQSPHIQVKVNRILSALPEDVFKFFINRLSIDYRYPINRLSIGYRIGGEGNGMERNGIKKEESKNRGEERIEETQQQYIARLNKIISERE